MDLLNLPTESLYKFEAFAGLVLAFGSFFYLFKQIDSARMLMFETNLEAAILQLEISDAKERFTDVSSKHVADIKEEFKRLDEEQIRIDALPKEQRAAPLKAYKERVEQVKVKNALAKELLAKSVEHSLIHEIKFAKVNGKVEVVKYQYNKIVFLRAVGIVTVCVGLWLSVIGFRRWSVVQDDIDAAVHKQAIEAKK